MRKKETITEDGKHVLSKLLVYLFALCYSAMSLSTIININDILEYLFLILAGAAFAVLMIVLANLLAKPLAKEKLQRNILIYALAFSNIGYFGYPIVGAMRLLLLPLITIAIFCVIRFCGASGETFTLIFRLSVIVSALPVGMNTVVYPESVGQDGTEGAKVCFMSYILALVTLPLVFVLMEAVVVAF